METFKNLIITIFDPTPSYSIYTNAFFVLSAILFIGGIALKILIQKKKKADKTLKKQFKKYPARLITFAIFLFLYLLCRIYHIAFLSMRIFLYILTAGIIWTLYTLIKTYTHDYPVDKKRREQ